MTGICLLQDVEISYEHQVSECFSERYQHGKSISDLDLAVSSWGSILLESSSFPVFTFLGFFGNVCITCDQEALKGVRKASCEFNFIFSQLSGKPM